MATAANRIYTVTNRQSGVKHLVEANHPAAALKLAISAHYLVEVTTTSELASLMEAGAHITRAPTEPAAA